LGVLIVAAVLGALYAWYQFAKLGQPAVEVSTVEPQASTTNSGLKAIQQAEQRSLQTSSTTIATPQVLNSIQQAQVKAQQSSSVSSGGGTSGSTGSSGISPDQAAQLKAIQDAQLKASQQSSGQ
jgi:hypothetical protein